MNKYIDFDMNHNVKVKITKIGLDELERQHNERKEAFPMVFKEFITPKVDEDGFSKWQMWCLMSDLGHLLGNGFDVPFMPCMKIEVEEQ